MQECRRKYEEEMRKLHRPMLDRLRELLAKKRDIESQLEQYHDLKDQTFEAAVQHYQTAATDRTRQIEVEDD
ncbi:hypothetical protein DOTSEDRAFT_75294 [Dothistroma septosporum NZE10]|uniref:Uncharacterized protein n=1 Tax=Dothistroma septosporum (strain NZE10 / CBS 128990) TaxID=675120 RepID=M2XJF1_DOTSN|nr:hypothetical protein DOTSEDRAFT_75294 [Dothistroma septosporum NZE10]